MARSPERHSIPPASIDDRTTERRLIPSVAAAADSSRDVAQEDFLFHLYRGSELLQENRVLEAKEELEFALTMQPLDPKGQDLLGAVYFRLGLYPRAIQIYEGLVAQFARDVSVKINLALCYLKTGQPEPARRTLQDAVRLNPDHKRAWGYLGLALQKLGELEQAQIAFERGGHTLMAKRITERRQRPSTPAAPSLTPEIIDDDVREVAETAFWELDAGELRFALAEPEPPRPADGPWHTLELGEAAKIKSPYARTLPPPSVRAGGLVHETATVPPPPIPLAVPGVPEAALAASTRLVPPPPEPNPRPRPATPPPPPSAEATPERTTAPPLLAAEAEERIVLHSSGAVIVRTGDDLGPGPAQAFAGRLEALRVVSGALATRVLHRRAREAETTEVLGGLGSPLVRMAGGAELVLGARSGQLLVLLALDDELAFVREDALLGFELRLAYENGRVALEAAEAARSPAEGAQVVQLRGTGTLVLELAGPIASLPSTPGRPLLVRREWIVGWLGRLVTRALPPSESPGGQRGLVGFSGQGSVIVCTG
jgi:hypothetical protein